MTPASLRSTGIALWIAACAATISSTALAQDYAEIFYPSGPLRIQAYFYKPAGAGPFPLIIYNHGSRAGRERESVPFRSIGELLTGAGYAVLVPERRGYAQSAGKTPTEDIGSDTGPRFVARLQAETDDVLAAVDYLRGVPDVDASRLGIMGWSLGGIVTMFAISRSTAFKVAVNQAGGALTWTVSAALREALVGAARRAQAPVLLLVAANDRTTESITALDRVLSERNWPHAAKIYPPFVPPRSWGPAAPGHAVFSRDGVGVWRGDVIAFLDRHLKTTGERTLQ